MVEMVDRSMFLKVGVLGRTICLAMPALLNPRANGITSLLPDVIKSLNVIDVSGCVTSGQTNAV